MRKAKIERKTKETKITVKWVVDGAGVSNIKTGMPFMDHMLDLFSKHGFFDLDISLKGDLEIDEHHSIEDLGIVMGQALKQALGDKKGIKRYGSFLLPMDESLVQIALDISNRPHLTYDVKFPANLQGFDQEIFKEFFEAFVQNGGITLHIKQISGDNSHHIAEAIFKGLAKALDIATCFDSREKGIPSTKGIL